MALPTHIAEGISRTALSLVTDERLRQLNEKGWTYEHDDQHGSEELAAAAAFYLVPSWMNPDVAQATGSGRLEVIPLQPLIGEGAWDDITRDHDDPESDLDLRIDNVVRGVALGLAELERLMRMREAAQGGE